MLWGIFEKRYICVSRMLGVYVVWGMALRGLVVICIGRRFES